MTLGQRIEHLRIARSISSISELARLAGVAQSTMSGLINGPSRWSPHLPKIARVLRTSVEYLLGEVDDPDENALPPPPDAHFQPVTFEVLFPSQPALEQMFAGLLLASEGMSTDELAHELAVQLPNALALARSARPSPRPYQAVRPEEQPEVSRDVRSGPSRS